MEGVDHPVVCLECGQEILGRAKFCPVCGATLSNTAASPDSRKGYQPKTFEEQAVVANEPQENSNRWIEPEDNLFISNNSNKRKRDRTLLYSGVGLLALGIMQSVILNPFLTSGFSTWDRYAYIRGVPWFICAVLPYSMIACDLIVVITGLLGFFLARWRGAAVFYRIFSFVITITSSALLVMRIIHGHVVFKSVGGIDYESMPVETILNLQKNYSQSLYPMFIMTAIAALISLFFFLGSARFGKQTAFNAVKAMIVLGIAGVVCSFTGVLFGGRAGESVPLVSIWTIAAFITMLVTGIAGLSKHRSPSARIAWGIAQFSVFTFCMLQAIHYSYSATAQGTFFYSGPFLLITALSGLLAVSTILSAVYMSGAVFILESGDKHDENSQPAG